MILTTPRPPTSPRPYSLPFEVLIPKPLASLGGTPPTPIESLVQDFAARRDLQVDKLSVGVYVPLDDPVAAADAIRREEALPAGTTALGGIVSARSQTDVDLGVQALSQLSRDLLPGINQAWPPA